MVNRSVHVFMLSGLLGMALAAAGVGCGKKKGGEQRPGASAASTARPRTVVVRPARGNQEEGRQARPETRSGGEVVADGLPEKMDRVTLAAPVTKKNYVLKMSGPAKLAAGSQGVYEVSVVPKTPYKVNKLFPHSIQVQAVSGNLEVAKKVLKKGDAAVFEPHKLVFKVTVKSKDGKRGHLEALFKFSVCTPKFCETPKAKLVLDVNGPKGADGGAGAAAPRSRP